MSVSEIRELNAVLVEKIDRETLADPHAQYAGKWVGVANGKVVAVADTLDDVARELERIEPDRARARIIEASRDYSVVQYVWENRGCHAQLGRPKMVDGMQARRRARGEHGCVSQGDTEEPKYDRHLSGL